MKGNPNCQFLHAPIHDTLCRILDVVNVKVGWEFVPQEFFFFDHTIAILVHPFVLRLVHIRQRVAQYQ